MSEENTAQRKPRGRDSSLNPFRFKKDQEETGELQSLTPRVDFNPETKPGSPTFVYSRETSYITTPVSAHTLKLLEAVREDKLEFVEDELCHLNKQDIDKTDRHGFALIHVAARYNLHRIVNALLKHGADVNIGTSEYRWTPLHLAARFVETCKVYVFYIAFIFISQCNDNYQNRLREFSFVLASVMRYVPIKEIVMRSLEGLLNFSHEQ